MGKIKRIVLILVATISVVLMPVAANAAGLLQCDNNGHAVANTSLFDADPATDPGKKSGVCQYTDQPPVQHVFSLVICEFVVILNSIMDEMYCGIHYYMINVISALLTLYVAVYGAQILMGTAQLTTRDSMIRLLKLSFIYVFSTKSAYGISFIFRFFLAFIGDASTAVLNTLSSQVGPKSDGLCKFDGLVSNDIMSMYNFLDYLVCHSLIGPASQANTKVQGLMFAMIIALPPMTLLFQWWIMTTIKTLVMTLVAFLQALAGIAFLTTLSPVFLGFFLFESTKYVFDNWLRYLTSFSVQVVMVLAIVVFWILTIDQFVVFFNDMSKLIFPYKPVKTEASLFLPSNGWGICPGVYGTDTNGLPTAKCDTDEQGRVFDAEPPECTKDSSVSPPTWTCKPPNSAYWQEDGLQLIPPEKIINQGEFLYFVFYHLFTLLLISYCYSVLLGKAKDIARSLAGPATAPQLVPGFGNGLGSTKNFQAPGFAGRNPNQGQATKNLGEDFRKLVGNR